MRILIDYRPALRHRTGVGEYVHELTKALLASAPAGAPEHLTLFSSSWKDRLAPDVLPAAAVVDRRVPVQLLNAAWHRLGWPPVEMLTGRTFDVVQASHPLPIPTPSAARVVTIYDLHFLDHPEHTHREIRRDYAALVPGAVQHVDHVLTISRHTASAIEQRLGVSPADISICTPGAPPWAPRRTEPDAGYILFFGTLEPRKNVGVLLDAYERFICGGPASAGLSKLVLAGATPPDAAPLIARTTTAPLAGHVEVRGYVSPDDREALYRGAVMLVMPSHTEGFGLPALEAMTVGVPVIAANRGALPDVVGDAGLLVEPDATALADAMARLASDPTLRGRLREAAWTRARRFQWSESAALAREGWHKAVERRRRRG